MQPQAQPNQFLDHLNFRPGITDIPCPVCGPNCKAASNRRRKVLRVWNNDGFITYNCARCGAQGVATIDKPMPATPLPQKDNSERMALAERLWGMAHHWPICFPYPRIYPHETYLRVRKCFWPSPSIRYLSPDKGRPPRMVAKFQGVSAVHITKLQPDGMGKAGTDHDKVIVGPYSGFPIVIRSSGWSNNLIISEGIEDGLSLSLAFPHWTVWSAGSSSVIHRLINADKPVIVAVDDDMAGQKAAERCLSINPQTSVIKFPKGLDANAILVQHGLNALRDFVSRHQPFHR